MNHFLSMGIIGFTIVLVANLVALYGFGQKNAVFFSQTWYATWFPNYIVWFVFTVIGAAYYFSKNKSGEDR
jgi:hypothetical protein